MKPLPFKMIQETEIEKWRAETFWTKEPETLAWIDSMQPGEVLFDVGANIGIYTLYAASRGVKVYSIEPLRENFIRLEENIRINKFDNSVIAMYLALGESDDRAMFSVKESKVGSSGSQVGLAIDEHGKEFQPQEVRWIQVLRPITICTMFNVAPDYIKVDVDGSEKQITESLMEPSPIRLNTKSLLIEVNTDQWPLFDAIGYMKERGYTFNNDFNRHPEHSRYRRRKEGVKAENVIFTRAK